MHNNYHFLQHLVPVIAAEWENAVLTALYTQEKNELIIQALHPSGKELYIKAHLSPAFCCLSFPETHHRARKNSMNLFRDAEEKRIVSIRLFRNERAFYFDLEHGFRMVFKLYGNKSNLVLFENGTINSVFRSELKHDFALEPTLDREIDQSFERFESLGGEYKPLYPTFGKYLDQYLVDAGYHDMSVRERWDLLQQTLAELQIPEFRVTDLPDYHITILPGKDGIHFTSPAEALNHFFQHYFIAGLLGKEKKAVIRMLEKRIGKTEKYLTQQYKKLERLLAENSYRLHADLLMAHMHDINKGEKKVMLPDFYTGKNVEITLNPRLTIQENAGHYYQKAKNQHLEVEQTETAISLRENALNADRQHLSVITGAGDLRTLRDYVKTHDLEEKKQAQQGERLPYREYEFGGFIIRVGRNAKSNDKLLQQFSYKEDLWLHAKDSPGSHVLIKHQSGRVVPLPVIEKAASLAAFYSRRKNDTLCPVIVTPRKYVRKRKGDPPGMVIVDREEKVVLVPPEDI